MGFFGQLDKSGPPVTFYDARCGIPLFIAPKGRSWADFEQESVDHGWPSFRDGEVVSGNVVEAAGGEVVSSCGTHLGHNIPDFHGNRYCINLMCIAGNPGGSAASLLAVGTDDTQSGITL